MKTFIIVDAQVITPKGTEPFVGLTVNLNGKTERIARTCKQALLDLHKSARGSKLPAKLFDNGYSKANAMLVRQFDNEIIGLVGKTGIGDIETYTAGDEYVATATSAKVISGVAKVGDTLQADKDGTRVEGFLSFPLLADELMRRDLISEMASTMALNFQAMMGIASAQPVVEASEPKTTGATSFTAPEDEHKASHEAFGSEGAEPAPAKTTAKAGAK